MVEAWFIILCLMLTVFVVLEGWDFGAGALHLIVARTRAERRQLIAAIGPLWSWHEVWLIGSGGVLFAAFPTVLASSFAGFYLALNMILWSLLLRGISIEVGGHLDDALWQSFWDFVFALSNLLLAVLFGAALGNVLRGVPLDENGKFSLPLFTHFDTHGHVGILDWYTISVAGFTVLILLAHGAAYLEVKTEGAVHARSAQWARRLWPIVMLLFPVITAETWYVRPDFAAGFAHRPLSWLSVAAALGGIIAVFAGQRKNKESLAFAGSCTFIIGLMAGAAASVFPTMLHSTLAPEHSITAYNGCASIQSLTVALWWWPFAFVLACIYFVFILRNYRGKAKETKDTQGFY